MLIGRAAVLGLRWPADADADADVVAAQLSHTSGFEIAVHSSATAHCSATELRRNELIQADKKLPTYEQRSCS